MASHSPPPNRTMMLRERGIVWLAQGFGVGRIPVAPGTFGTLLGIVLTCLLIQTRNWMVYLAVSVAATALAIWICDAAEKILHEADPSSVVIDEIVAIPVCFSAWLPLHFRPADWPSFHHLFTRHWLALILIFAAFRLFDIAKPWPIRGSQNLPGGLGVVVDDILAGLFVAAATVLVWLVRNQLPI